jgi:hypothetical protein
MDLVASARIAGASGKSWHDWVMSDEIQDAIAAAGSFTQADQDAIEKAFAEGRRDRAAVHGRVIWTTAPSDYDTADATELEVVGDYFGKPLRKIALDPEGYQYQTGRYASGTYGVWDQDPIEEDRLAREKYARQDAERAAVEAKHQAGAAWLRTATDAELADEDLCWERGATHKDVRAERQRRHEAAADEERTMGLGRITALIPEGATLIDAGAYIPPPMAGMRPVHRPARVYYNVHLVHGWPDDADHAKIEHGTGRRKETVAAAGIVDLLVKGQIRVAAEGEVPPAAVVDRIGVDRWKEIRRVAVGDRVVWVGRATFGSEDLVLDENGKLVRARKLVDAAKAAAAKQGEGHAWGGRRRMRRRAGYRPRAHAQRSSSEALLAKYGRATGSRVRLLGLSSDVTSCEHCGKKDLGTTAILSINGGRPIHYGMDCARRVLRKG